MAVYYFAFIGVESSLRTFTSTFAVSSSLKLTRAQVAITDLPFVHSLLQGSDLLAFFYLTFAASRALVIPLSIWVKTLFIQGLEFFCPGCSWSGCPWLSSPSSPLFSLPLSLGNSLLPRSWPGGSHGRRWGSIGLCQWHGRSIFTGIVLPLNPPACSCGLRNKWR